MRRAALIAMLILASCSANSQTNESSAPELTTTSSTTVAPTTTDAVDANSAEEDPGATEDSSTTTTTTTTLPPDAAPDFAISQIVFGDDSFVVITNWGDAGGSLDGYWLSQAATVQALPDITLEPSEQAVLGTGTAPPPDLAGMAAVFHLGRSVGLVDPDSGELSLHNNDQFDDPASLVGYVSWGEGPHARTEQAIAAGLWDGEPVPVFDDAPSISTGVFPATTSLDWSIDIGG